MLLRSLLIVGLSLVAHHAYAAPKTAPGAASKPSAKGAEKNPTRKAPPEATSRTSEDNRRDSTVLLGYSYVVYGLVLPGRKGPAVYWIYDDEWEFGFDYTGADYSFSLLKVDLATFEEKVYHATARWFPGNSFNLTFGLGQRSYDLRLGTSYFEKYVPATQGVPPLIQVENQILSLAIGNQWQWDWGGSLSADWLTLYVTVGQGKEKAPILDYVSGEGRSLLNGLVSYLRYGPTFALARLTFGFAF